jgi:hypothetical protein
MLSFPTRRTRSIYCVFFVLIWNKQDCINFFAGKYIARFGFSISVLANTCHVWLFNFCARKYIARFGFQLLLTNSNMTSLFPFVKKTQNYFFVLSSLAHAPMYVTDVSIGSIKCDPNNADRGRSIIRAT